jgi:hypothetical protein
VAVGRERGRRGLEDRACRTFQVVEPPATGTTPSRTLTFEAPAKG